MPWLSGWSWAILRMCSLLTVMDPSRRLLVFINRYQILSIPAYSCRRSILMYLGRLRHRRIASFCTRWSLSRFPLLVAMKEELPYSISDRIYTLYSLIMTGADTRDLDKALRTFMRRLALVVISLMCLLNESRLSKSIPRKRASAEGLMTSSKRATL